MRRRGGVTVVSEGERRGLLRLRGYASFDNVDLHLEPCRARGHCGRVVLPSNGCRINSGRQLVAFCQSRLDCRGSAEADAIPSVLSVPCCRSKLTHTGRSADAQHSCCKNAEDGNILRVHRNRRTFDRSRRRWQLSTQDRFRSSFREGPQSDILLLVALRNCGLQLAAHAWVQ